MRLKRLTIKYVRTALLTAFCLSLAACSGGGSNSRIDYKEAKTLPSLEVPPELEAPIDSGVENVPELGAVAPAAGDSRVLPQAEGIRIVRDGSTRWLVIDADAEQLWPKLRQFWSSLGLEIKQDEPAIGIMETQWAENRADTPTGFLARLVKKVFKNAYSASTRDKYRIRLEPAGDNRTELYLSHYGLKEVVPESQTGEIVDTLWEVRPSDPELANEILNRLIVFLGGSKQTATEVLEDEPQQPPSRARLQGETLILSEGFNRAWRLTGLALDRIGLVVQDRNRSEGIYYVSRVDQLEDAGVEGESWFGSLFSGEEQQQESQQWQIRLNGNETSTRITVRDEQGVPLAQKQSVAILQRLQESLR